MRAPKHKLKLEPKARAGGDKYRLILDAAISVFAERGFHAARVSDVAERAKVADGTIYLYFRNKEELLMTAINTAFDVFMSRARAELGAISSPAEKLRRLAHLHLEALSGNRDLAVVFQSTWESTSGWCGRQSEKVRPRESFVPICATKLPPTVFSAHWTRLLPLGY
jgi:AcrR family transcriptional regulator